MSAADTPEDDGRVDWSVVTWEGSRREQLRRWAQLPLERAILALEEMESLHRGFHPTVTSTSPR